MEYLFDFFAGLFEIAAYAVQKLWDAAQSRKKKAENTSIKNANEMPDNDRLPKSVKDKTSQDNMDISREDFAKMSKEEQQKYRNDWNALPAEQKQQRLNAFTQKQMPFLQQAYNDEVRKELDKLPEMKELKSHGGMDISEKEYKALSKEEKKQKEAEWKALTPEEKKQRLEAFEARMEKERGSVMREKWNSSFQKYFGQHGSVTLYKNPPMNVPKIVQDQMAFELKNPWNGTTLPLPISNENWAKMNNTKKMNFINSFTALNPEQQMALMKGFQAHQQKNISRAWRYYTNVTGCIIAPLPDGQQYAVYSSYGSNYMNAVDRQIQQQKKQSQSERQKEELQNQKLDGKGKETELEMQEIEKNRQLNEAVKPGQEPVPQNQQTTTQPDRNGISQSFVPQVEAPKGVNLQEQIQQLQNQSQQIINGSLNRQPTEAARQRLQFMQENNISPLDAMRMSAQQEQQAPVQQTTVQQQAPAQQQDPVQNQTNVSQGFGARRNENNGVQMNSAQSFNQSMNKYESEHQVSFGLQKQEKQNEKQMFDDVKDKELDPDYERKQQERQKGAAQRKENAKNKQAQKQNGLDKNNQPMMGVPKNNK